MAKGKEIDIPVILKKVPSGDFFLIIKLSGRFVQEFMKYLGKSPGFLHNKLAVKTWVPINLMRAFVDFVGEDINIIAEQYEEELVLRAKQRENRRKLNN